MDRNNLFRSGFPIRAHHVTAFSGPLGPPGQKGLNPTTYDTLRLMVSIKEATSNAAAFARDALGPERTEGIRLEEVESTSVDGENAWLITLSMVIADEPADGFLEKLRTEKLRTGRREYKNFTVVKRDGEVRSMKIRELADA